VSAKGFYLLLNSIALRTLSLSLININIILYSTTFCLGQYAHWFHVCNDTLNRKLLVSYLISTLKHSDLISVILYTNIDLKLRNK